MKGLFKFLIVLVILAGLAIFGLGTYLDTAAKKAVEKGGTYALGVPTTLDVAALDLRAGNFALNGLHVANPEGFEGERFLGLEGITLEVPLTALLADPIEVKRLVIDGLQLDLEQRSSESNAKAILANLERLGGSGDEAGDAESGEAGSGGKRLTIAEVVIKNVGVSAKVEALGKQLAEVELTLPEFTLSNVGTENGGETVAQLTRTLLQAVLARVAKEGGGVLPADLLQGMNQGLADLKASAAGAVDGAREVLDQELDAAKDKVEGELDAAKDEVEGEVDAAKDKLKKGLEGLGKDADKALNEAAEGLGGLLGGKKKGGN